MKREYAEACPPLLKDFLYFQLQLMYLKLIHHLLSNI